MRQSLSSGLVLAIGLLFTGAVMGFYVRPLLRPELQANSELASSSPIQMMEAARMVAACNFDPDQLDRLAGRMAPLLAQQLNRSSGKTGVNVAETSQQRESREQEKAAQIAAFSNATVLVDQMIASHHVSHEGMAEAIRVLQKSDQVDRAYELQGKIAAAMNRGELTPEEAGIMVPGRAQSSR